MRKAVMDVLYIMWAFGCVGWAITVTTQTIKYYVVGVITDPQEIYVISTVCILSIINAIMAVSSILEVE